MSEFTRLGTPPADRPGALRSTGGMTCPDVLIAGGRVLVIGQHLRGGDLLGLLPPTTGVGPGETVVEIPAEVFDDAARDRITDARLAASEAEGQAQRDRAQLQFVHSVLAMALRADFRSELLWHSDGTTVRRRETWWLPHPNVQPIPGEDYQILDQLAEWVTGPLPGRPEVSIHRPHCRPWENLDEVTTEIARALVLGGRAFVCLLCKPPIPLS